MKQIFRAVGIITFFTILTRILGFVYKIVLAKQIGAEGLGIYQIVISVFFVLISLTSSGIPVTISRKSSVYLKNNDWDSHFGTVRAGILFNLLIATVLSILILVFQDSLKWLFADSRCMILFLYMLPAFVFSSIYAACRGGLWGEKRFFQYSLIECIEELLLVVFGVIFMTYAESIFSKTMFACFAITLSYCIASVISLAFFISRKRFLKHKSGLFVPLIKSSTPITAIRLSATLLSFLVAILVPSRLIASGMTQRVALENFGIFTGMTLPLFYTPLMLVGVIALVIVPELAQIKDDNLKLQKSIKYCLISSTGFACLFIPLFATSGVNLTAFLFDNEFAGSLLSKIAPFMIFMCLSQITTTILNSLGYELTTMKNFIIGAAFLLICIIVLPKFIGIYGLAVGFCGNYVVQTSLNFIALRKRVRLELKVLLPCLSLVILLFPITLFVHYISNLSDMILPPLATIALCGIVSTVLFTILILTFGNFKKTDLFQKKLGITNK